MRRAIAAVADIALWLTAIVGAAALVATLFLFATGARPVVVQSGSMEPTYPTRSVAVVRPVAVADVAVGDVLAVETPAGTRVLHRVTERTITPNGVLVTLKGDANETADSTPVLITEAYRAGAKIPHVGALATVLRSPLAGFAIAVALLGPVALRARHPAGGRARPLPV